MDHPRGTSRLPCAAIRRILAVLAIAVLAAGCRLDVVAEVAIGDDGGAVVDVSARLDDELLAELDRLGVDPTAELAAVTASSWELTRVTDEQDGVTVGLRRTFDDAGDVGPALRELTSSLAEGDPGIDVDVEVEVTDDGAASVRGDAALRAPSSVGAAIDGEPIGPSEQRLAELTDEVVDARLVVRTPGEVVSSNGRQREATVVDWELDVDAPTPVELESRSPSWVVEPWLGAAGAAAAVLAAIGIVVRRRRISRGA